MFAVSAVLLETVLLKLRAPSRKNEQFMSGDRLSVAVKLNISGTGTLVTIENPFAGALSVMAGAITSTVKFLVSEFPVLFAGSLHDTLQL
jgi:hypothetical protein